MWMEISVAGNYVGQASCGDSTGFYWRPPDGRLAAYGYRPGEPMTLTATVTSAWTEPADHQPLPATGSFAFAVMQRVPFDEYPFPPRPATLTPLEEQPGPLPEFELRSDPDDPLRPASTTVAWSPGLELRVASQTPGYVHIFVNDTLVATHESWAYDLGQTGVSLGDGGMVQFPEGTVVTIRAVPERTTGAWSVRGWHDPVR